MRARRLLGSVAMVCLAGSLGLAACGDDDEEADDAETTESAGDDQEGTTSAPAEEEGDAAAGVTAEGFAFSPGEITVTAGSEVSFTNADGVTHTLTADDDSFDTGNVGGGETATLTAPAEPGDYDYHCEIHSSMTGTLTVD
ncbi:MAG: cupredoxin domain-containing protein [Acidimicrobiales bacterium]